MALAPNVTSGFKRWTDRLFENGMFRIFVALVLLDWAYAGGRAITLGFIEGIRSVMGG